MPTTSSWWYGPERRPAQADNRPTGRSKIGRGFHPKKKAR